MAYGGRRYDAAFEHLGQLRSENHNDKIRHIQRHKFAAKQIRGHGEAGSFSKTLGSNLLDTEARPWNTDESMATKGISTLSPQLVTQAR